jgi:hypothetical protein
MRSTPVGQKWVIRYKHKSGEPGLALTDHYSKLPFVIQVLYEKEASHIIIEDETIFKEDE